MHFLISAKLNPASISTTDLTIIKTSPPSGERYPLSERNCTINLTYRRCFLPATDGQPAGLKSPIPADHPESTTNLTFTMRASRSWIRYRTINLTMLHCAIFAFIYFTSPVGRSF
ncbi:hypothetical protein QFZ99_000787 [Paraburkholderia atlantica]